MNDDVKVKDAKARLEEPYAEAGLNFVAAVSMHNELAEDAELGDACWVEECDGIFVFTGELGWKQLVQPFTQDLEKVVEGE